ncbi:MAG: DegT/DnrJ/EryC1/StrS family aminotransferase [Pseudomonadales bacterium]
MQDLAVFGGSRSFEAPVIVGEPVVDDVPGVLEDLGRVLNSRRLTNNGPWVQAFEEAVKQATRTKYCIATDNGTSALQIAARALALRGEIIVPAFTFIATAHAFAWQGLRPVFVDVDPDTHTIDVQAVEAAITPQTTAICGVHLWGNLCDVAALTELADRHDLALLFDAAHALGCENAAGIPVGSFGDAEVLSFHATKFVSAFEGGAVVTNDDALARQLGQLRNFGFDDSGRVQSIGINAKMSEASAVMGLHSLRHYDDIVAANRSNLQGYRNQLGKCAGIDFVVPRDIKTSNCQYVVVVIDERETGISRDALLACLRAEGIFAKAYFEPPCHLAEPYRVRQTMTLPVSEQLGRSVLCLPSGRAVGCEQIDGISDLIRFILKCGPEVENRLEGGAHVPRRAERKIQPRIQNPHSSA